MLKYVRTIHQSLAHCDKHLIIDGLFGLILDKSKEVKAASQDFCRDAVAVVDEDQLDLKIKDQKHFVQDVLRQAISKLSYKRGPLIKLDRETNGIKQIKANKAALPARALDIEFSFTTDSDGVQTFKPRKPAPLAANFNSTRLNDAASNPNSNKGSSDLELALRLLSKNDAANGSACIIPSVADFGEPTDIEVANMHSALSYILNDSFSNGLFSFESSVLKHSIENLKRINIFNKKNMLKLFQYVFIRVFDTHRKAILEAVEGLLEFMVQQARAMQITFNDERETLVVFHTFVRFFISAGSINVELLMKFLPQVSIDQLSSMLYGLLNNPNCIESKALLLSLTELIVVEYAKGNLSVSKDFLLYLKSIEFSYPAQVSRILSCLSAKLSEQGPIKDKDIQMILENAEANEVFRLDDFSDIGQLLARLENGSLTPSDVLANCEPIVHSLIAGGNELILYEKFKDSNQRATKNDAFLVLLQKLCQVKGLLDNLSLLSCQKMLEHLVLYLIKADQERESPTSRNNKAFITDEVIKIINSSVLKLLELNSPNVLFDALFGILDAYNGRTSNAMPADNGIKTTKVKLTNILVKCVIKLTKILKQVIDRLDLDRLMRTLNNYVIKYCQEKEDLGMKCIKTIVHELVALKGAALMDVCFPLQTEDPPAIVLLINKYLMKTQTGNHGKEDLGKKARPESLDRGAAVASDSKGKRGSKQKSVKKQTAPTLGIEDNNLNK